VTRDTVADAVTSEFTNQPVRFLSLAELRSMRRTSHGDVHVPWSRPSV